MPKIKIIEIDYLERFRDELFSCKNELEIEARLSWFLEFYDVINVESFYSQPYWRGRKCKDSNGFENVRELMAPPSEITKPGRVNEQYKPMFYASLSADTALNEIRAEKGDYVHLTAFVGDKEKRIRCVLIGEILNAYRSITKISPVVTKNINKIINKLDPKYIKAYVFMDALVAEIMSDKHASKKDYIFSRVLSRLLQSQVNELEGIIYPSVVHDGSMNIAIKPNTSIGKLDMNINMVVRVLSKYSYGLYDVEIVNTASYEDSRGRIVWKRS